MFTGLIKEVGVVKNISRNKEGKLLTISSKVLISDIDIDDSVSVNGACQTVVSYDASSFTVQAVGTTLEKTTLDLLKVGQEVNLELALRASDRLGGHLVQGHVNGMALIHKFKNIGDNYIISLKLNQNLMRYVVKEGSITINGVSLTVCNVESGEVVSVSVIPHTWFHTTFKNMLIGEKVNIEVDIIAKYVENLLKYENKYVQDVNSSNITESWLREKGF